MIKKMLQHTFSQQPAWFEVSFMFVAQSVHRMSLILSASGFGNPFIFTAEIEVHLHNCWAVFKLKLLCRRITILTSIVKMFAIDAQANISDESYKHLFFFFFCILNKAYFSQLKLFQHEAIIHVPACPLQTQRSVKTAWGSGRKGTDEDHISRLCSKT